MNKEITVAGDVVVVWAWTHDSSEMEPKLVDDLEPNARRKTAVLTQDVGGLDVWVLVRKPGQVKVQLTRYYADGREQVYVVPDDLSGPPEDMPANVWERASDWAHVAVCTGRQGGCHCQ